MKAIRLPLPAAAALAAMASLAAAEPISVSCAGPGIGVSLGETSLTLSMQPISGGTPAAGQCALTPWMVDGTPLPSNILMKKSSDALRVSAAAKGGGTFRLTTELEGGVLRVVAIGKVKIVEEGVAEEAPSGPCGGPGAIASVSIPDPSLTHLNVRTKPGGKIVGKLPRGAIVRVAGTCGNDNWCDVSGAVAGCVMGEYLDFENY